MLTKYKLVIFDWDGTVMDSIGRIVSSLDSAARLTGTLPLLEDEALKQMIGLSLEKGFTFLYPEADLAHYPVWVEHYRQEFVSDNKVPSHLYPNSRAVLEHLKHNGLMLAVATGKTRVGLDRAMRETQTQALFAATRCADETRSKPDPTMINELLDELGVAPEDAVMIGDTNHDMALANNAGVDAIGITWGVHGADVLSQFRPKHIIKDLRELVA